MTEKRDWVIGYIEPYGPYGKIYIEPIVKDTIPECELEDDAVAPGYVSTNCT